MSDVLKGQPRRGGLFPAVLVLAAAAAGLGMPGLLSASETTTCNAQLIANSPTKDAQLGWAVAVSENETQTWLAAGANQDSAKGSVSMYLNPGPDTPQTGPKLIPADLQPGDQFGSSVSISGTWLAVGAPVGDGKVQDSGVVYLFKLDGSTWGQPTKLEATDAKKGAQLGFSVSLNGNTLVVGAPGDSDRGSSAGAAYVFEMRGDVWTQTAKLLANDGRPFDEFGSSVATDGDKIVVGAPFADDLTVHKNFGAAYVFQRNANGWSLEDKGKLTAADTIQGNNIQFGWSVAIRRDRIVVGAPGDDRGPTDSGSAYVFERRQGPESGWLPPYRLGPEDPADPKPSEQFGTAVLIDAKDRVLIGTPFDDKGGVKVGAAYLFEKQNGNWIQSFKFLHDPGGAFGQSVTTIGDTVFMGGYLANVKTQDGALVNQAGAVATCPFGVKPRECPSISKTDNRDTVCPGDAVTYEITVSNDPSNASVTGATVVDDFSSISQLQDVSWKCTASEEASCSPTSGAQNLRSTVSLPPGKSVEFLVKAKVGAQATGTITNQASVTLSGAASSCAQMTDTTKIPGDLAIEIGGPTQIPEGEVATYAVEVSHSGAAMTGVQVTVEVTGGTPLPPAAGTPCVINTQGGFTCNLGKLSAGSSSVPLELKVQAPGGCPCPAAPITLTATVTANERECDDSNNTATASTAVTCAADLVLQSFTVVPPNPPQCGTITYKIDYKNLGPGFACGTFVEQSIPAGLTFVGPPSCQIVGSNVRCLIGDLPPNNMGTLQTSFGVPTVCQDPIDSNVKISSTTPDPNPSNNFDNGSAAETHCPPHVRITKTRTGSPDPVVPGQGLVYEITVKNTGGSAVSGAVVEDDFPPELRDVLWCRGAGCVPSLSPPLKEPVDLAAGETRVYRVSGIVQPMCSGVLHNKATITPPAGVCDDPAEALEDTQVVATGVLAFCEGISGPMLELTPITKTLLLINCGPADQADNPGDEFTDTLPAGLTLTGASATSGVASTSGNTAKWNGAIPAGGSVTISITANIDPGTAGMTLCNQATIAYDADGDGINESIGVSDDPDEPGPADPCCIHVIVIIIPGIPTLSADSLAALALLLAALAIMRLRRRSL